MEIGEIVLKINLGSKIARDKAIEICNFYNSLDNVEMGQQKLASTVVGDVDASKQVPVVLCERCGRDIYSISKTPEKTIEYSRKFHDGVFCYNCQQILRENKKTMDGRN